MQNIKKSRKASQSSVSLENPYPGIDLLDKEINRLDRNSKYKAMLVCFILTALITCFLLGVIFGIARISGSSMHPTLKHGDITFFSRLAQPAKGDIVLLHNEKEDYVKRIVGIPGDTIDIGENGDIIVYQSLNDFEQVQGLCGINYPLKLGENEYFVLGDDTNNSYDSRHYGQITVDKIRGTVVMIIRTQQLSD